MKFINSSSKERKRYILIKIKSLTRIERGEVSRLVAKAGLQFLGEFGMARAGIQVLPKTVKGSTAIIRVGHKYVNELRAALSLVKDSNGQQLAIECVRTSGTIRKLEKEQKSMIVG